MTYFIYIIKNPENKTYIGQTNNLDDRIRRHNDNNSKYTRNKGPYKLIYEEKFATRAEAMRREKELKSGKGREWIKNNILTTTN